jgi:uroporphyrinogen III methyltransferase/synthase
LFARNLDVRDLKGPKIAAVGKITAEALAAKGIRADLLPEKFTGDSLAASLVATGVENRRILLPRALKARETLPETLTGAGAHVTVAPVYQNTMPASGAGEKIREELRQSLQEKRVDMVTFTSSSTVKNFIRLLDLDTPVEAGKFLSGVGVAAIGPITARTAEQSGLHVDVQPAEYTIPDLVDSIVMYFTARAAG